MAINRRDFLKISALASASFMIPSFLKASVRGLQGVNANEKVLIVVQLSGGNDGLNTVVPFRNDNYYVLRPKLAIKAKDVLKMNDELGLNPDMTGLKELCDNGYLAIVNNVGYPNPDRSHFRSMDIWQTASNSNEYLSSGWVGRYLDSECNGCNNYYHAIEADETLSLALKGKTKTGLAFQDVERFYFMSNKKLYNDYEKKSKADINQNENVAYLYKILAEATSNAVLIHNKSKIYKSKQKYPDTQFAKNLKMISELIISGLETKIYYTSFSGFDTHVNQNNKQNVLLKQYSEAIKAFTDDLKQNGRINDILILTFSEFGRRVQENASGGTDHGTASNVYLISGSLKQKGITNSAPDLTNLDHGDLKYNVDFRSIYQNILKDWLSANPKSILTRDFEKISII